jgi:hypothetical protein
VSGGIVRCSLEQERVVGRRLVPGAAVDAVEMVRDRLELLGEGSGACVMLLVEVGGDGRKEESGVLGQCG